MKKELAPPVPRGSAGGPRKKQAHGQWPDIMLTAGKYCSVSLSHRNSFDRVSVRFVAGMVNSPDNLHGGLFQKIRKTALFSRMMDVFQVETL